MNLSRANKVRIDRKGYRNLQPLDPQEHPELAWRIEAMKVRAGLPNLQIYVGDYPQPQSSSFGKEAIVVSRSMLEILNPRESAAILGHEMGHSVHNAKHKLYTLLPLIGAMVGGAFADSALDRLTPRRMPFRNATVLIGSVAATAMLYRPLQKYFIGKREAEADRLAVEVSQDPEAFASALGKMEHWFAQHRGISLARNGYKSPQERVYSALRDSGERGR